MGYCQKFLLLVTILYAGLLCVTIYKIYFPSSCQYLQPSSPSFSSFKQLCYDPLWPSSDHQVQIQLYLGKSKPEGLPIWTLENHTISKELSAEITFTLPSNSFSHEDDRIQAWFVYTSHPNSQVSKNKKHTQRHVFIAVNLAEKRYLKSSFLTALSSSADSPSRYLLSNDKDGNEKSPIDKEKESKKKNTLDHFNKSLPYLHWKYSSAPLVIRYIPLYTTLESKVYHETFLQSMKRQKNPFKPLPKNATEEVYNPLLWLDDLSISTNHYRLMTSLPRHAISTPSSASETPESPSITISFQYLPTSPLLYFLKFIFFIIINFLTNLSSLITSAATTHSSSSSLSSPPSFDDLSLDSIDFRTLFTLTPPSSPHRPSTLDPMIDELRYQFSDDHLYFFFLSSLITYLHFYLEYLIFYSDYLYFVSTNQQHQYKGISLSSHLYSLYKSIILFLYLSHASSSSLILFSVFKDILYSLWKLYHLLRHLLSQYTAQFQWITWDLSFLTLFFMPLSLSFPIGSTSPSPSSLSDPSSPSPSSPKKGNEVTLATSSTSPSPSLASSSSSPHDSNLYLYYDYICSLHALLTTFPLLLGLALYNLHTYRYPSWYLWALNTLMDSIYYFGFISMIPQLYINYKLHSVAHLPIHGLFYKLFQTIIDDIFALLVKMPWKHKLMTLRDDVIFIFFIYQWAVYPSDPERVNEFGYQYRQQTEQIETQVKSEEEEEKEKEEKEKEEGEKVQAEGEEIEIIPQERGQEEGEKEGRRG